MCEYCGCQNNEVIAELTDEHDALRTLCRDLLAAAEIGHASAAGSIAEQMREVLRPHTAVEEGGLFPALASEFEGPIAGLVADHVALDASLAELSAPFGAWQQTARDVVADLFEHILKEQDGVFPAALATLSADEWESVAAARTAAHATTLPATTLPAAQPAVANR